MNTIATENIEVEPVAIRAWYENRSIYFELYDERIVSFPTHKFSRLANATDDQLSAVRLRAEGTALRWDGLDEDISISGILKGIFETV